MRVLNQVKDCVFVGKWKMFSAVFVGKWKMFWLQML